MSSLYIFPQGTSNKVISIDWIFLLRVKFHCHLWARSKTVDDVQTNMYHFLCDGKWFPVWISATSCTSTC